LHHQGLGAFKYIFTTESFSKFVEVQLLAESTTSLCARFPFCTELLNFAGEAEPAYDNNSSAVRHELAAGCAYPKWNAQCSILLLIVKSVE